MVWSTDTESEYMYMYILEKVYSLGQAGILVSFLSGGEEGVGIITRDFWKILSGQDNKIFCVLWQDNQGFLAEADGQAPFLRYLLRLTENVYNKNLRVWVYSEVAPGYCSAFQDDYIVAEQDCQRILHPFICEKGGLS
jgi:hypothetical protein